ncbi:PilX N-terminal domain-containing pilus assembly protein [Endozoicomonas sp. 4G]|uniref:pilus assembly PilX family protein n=1 Tax=Endozoicomonas sp. 4G TaxID=2872754 RepID=UPI002078BA2C|nr:PilX N-terminal domain-containing pilus assembly protein [Endozoicomonas sp. 4G]
MKSPMKSQQGSVLLVSLVLLLILTVTGITSIRMTSLEEKMTGNFRNEQLAFHSAEVAVLEAESYVANTVFSLASFNPDCSNGLCFSGSQSTEVGTCKNGTDRPWEDESVWSSSSKHRTTAIQLDGIAAQAKYIVEFRCYLPRESSGPVPDPASVADWARFYRITVLATGGSTDARVMLQTTYKRND